MSLLDKYAQRFPNQEQKIIAPIINNDNHDQLCEHHLSANHLMTDRVSMIDRMLADFEEERDANDDARDTLYASAITSSALDKPLSLPSETTQYSEFTKAAQSDTYSD